MGRGWCRRLGPAGIGLGFMGVLVAAEPEPVTEHCWRFDEPVAAAAGTVLADAGRGGLPLSLGRGATIVPGQAGGALRPGVAAEQPAAWGERLAGAGLPAGDWTLAFWLRLDPDADGEGVIFETGPGPRGRGELVQRLSVFPRENGFGFSAPAVDPGPGAVGRRVEFSRPDGPPHGVAFVQSVTLAPIGAPWPRGSWLRFEVGYDAAAGQLRLWRDGRVAAVAAIRLGELPAGAGYVAVGSDAGGGRPLRGAIDDLRLLARLTDASGVPP